MVTYSETMAEGLEIMPDEEKKGRTVRAGEVWIEVRVAEDAKARLAEWARRTGMSASLIMRRLLQEALDAGRDMDGVP